MVSEDRWERLHLGWRSRGHLPHFDMPGQYQFVTFRLGDSLPQAYHARIHAAGQAGSDEFQESLDAALDHGHGACWLRRPPIAGLVQDALVHFDGGRYQLLNWVIMPNHVHALLRVEPGWPLAKTVHSWKSFTANAANRLLGRSGVFWQADYFDRAMRSEQHLYQTAAYIEDNPVKARLAHRAEDWPFSSAFFRSARS